MYTEIKLRDRKTNPKTTKRILLIESKKSTDDLINTILRYYGYIVDVVIYGEEGLSILEKNNYHLILLDLKHPKTFGMELLKKIKSKGLTKTKIVIFTSLYSNTLVKKSFELGADGYELTDGVAYMDIPIIIGNYLSGAYSKENAEERIKQELIQKQRFHELEQGINLPELDHHI